MDPDFLAGLKDFFRGRFWQDGHKRYSLDVLLVGSTTLEEWEDFVADKTSRPLRERIHPITIPYNNSISQEAQIYQKELEVAGLADGYHLPHATLRRAAQLAVYTRLIPSSKTGLNLKERAGIYDTIAEFGSVPGTPRLVIDQLYEEARDKKECTDGISPTSMVDTLKVFTASSLDCLDPVRTMVLLSNQRRSPFDTFDLSWRDFLPQIKQEVEAQVRADVVAALHPDFYQGCVTTYRQYIENLDRLLQPKPQINPLTNIDTNAPDLAFLQQVEDLMPGRKFTPLTREHFRQGTRVKLNSVINKLQKPADFKEGQDILEKADGAQLLAIIEPDLSAAIQRKVANINTDMAQLLLGQDLNKSDQRVRETAIHRLTGSGDYCKHCVTQALELTARKIKQDTGLK